jgi:hypothetical protein
VRNTVQNTIKSFSAFLIFTSLAWAFDVPWKGKPYEQWNDKDLERVFTDSPWARTTTIIRTWLPVSLKEYTDKPLSGAGREMPTKTHQSDESAIGGELNFNVYWSSSRVMRAATARKAVLHAGKKDLDMEKFAAEPQEEYQIVLQSEDMTPFFRRDEKFFQENSFLEMRRTRLKLSPNHVRYEHGEDPKIVTAAVFFFPKKTPSGDPTIVGDEKNVEFNCKIEGTTLHVTFEPQKMFDNHGPAL